ncbi:hypothetical protein AAFF_G00106310 [Aldrovandia affinis]|uniref:Uncharacterized protein n=1 Tax=Aldrovandia affinis TaxID=143900 RepID=A0AAD7T243_9TELE|nr:hypothetical protein AAFF_G00106310 [Aldrovandia affinis]
MMRGGAGKAGYRRDPSGGRGPRLSAGGAPPQRPPQQLLMEQHIAQASGLTDVSSGVALLTTDRCCAARTGRSETWIICFPQFYPAAPVSPCAVLGTGAWHDLSTSASGFVGGSSRRFHEPSTAFTGMCLLVCLHIPYTVRILESGEGECEIEGEESPTLTERGEHRQSCRPWGACVRDEWGAGASVRKTGFALKAAVCKSSSNEPALIIKGGLNALRSSAGLLSQGRVQVGLRLARRAS